MPGGISMLLWRCPVCRTNGTLRHRSGWLRPETVSCTACHALWRVERVVAEDYRLTVIAGRPGVVGASRPLADWYAAIKANFVPQPIKRRVPDQRPDELVYLTSTAVPLLIGSGNPLLDGWQGPDAPRESRLRHDQPADWRILGTGRLDLTSQRLVWDDRRHRCDLWWRQVNTIFTFFRATFGVMYGREVYRFQFADDSILKWLTYASAAARPIATAEGRHLNTTHF